MKAPTGGGEDRELPPAGLTIGTCIKVIDLGTQERKYQEQVKHNREILVMFELPKHRIKLEVDGVEKDLPMAISKKYTLSFNKKATLRKDMEQWYGKKFDDKQIEAAGGFDPSKILGRPAQIMITHNETPKATYANIEGLMPLADGMPAPEQENESVLFDLDEFDINTWESFGEGMQKWIGKSPEMAAILDRMNGSSAPAAPAADIPEDDIPF